MGDPEKNRTGSTLLPGSSHFLRHHLRIQQNRIPSDSSSKPHAEFVGVIGGSETKVREVSRTSATITTAWMLVLSGFVAGPAQASGTLVLVPDFFGVLPVMLVGFAILIFPLNALLFKPIFSALDARAERIAGARQRSEQLQRQADAVLARYEAAVRDARNESEARRQARLEVAREEQVQLTAAARFEAETELDGARSELHRSVDEARESLRASADGLAQAAAEQVLGRALS